MKSLIIVLLLLSFSSCGLAHRVRNKIYLFKSGDIPLGSYKEDLKEVMERNPNFSYGSASLQEIENVFGETKRLRHSYRYPRIRTIEGQKKFFDLDIRYSWGYRRVEESPAFVDYIPQESIDVDFYLYQGKVQFYRIKHIVKDENDKWMNGKFNTLTFANGEEQDKNRNVNACDQYFYQAFSLNETRGDEWTPGYASDCDFDYDPNYWKDPIYQPIWNPKEMGTLEQLGIKKRDRISER